MYKRRLPWFLLSALLTFVVLVAVGGPRLRAGAGEDKTDKTADPRLSESLDRFAKVYSLVQDNYATPVDPDVALFGREGNFGVGAIPGMLTTLDPHSNFFDARSYSRFRENQEGKYYGIGARIVTSPNRAGKLQTTVTEPMPGSPALRAGVRPGDLIVEIDGKTTEGLDGEAVARRLKGPKGTPVKVTISREGYEQPLQFTLTRDEITGMSVDNYLRLRPGIGYIHISEFTGTTGDEFVEALKKLDSRNLKGLVLDLRGNRGGWVDSAVEVAGNLLPKDQLIVYHSGRSMGEKRFYSKPKGLSGDYPVVVLIDHGSASAAEIVAGALQDHDRALLMGETSFGKGLVQSIFPLSEGTGLALTVAHYFTPSGRLIQRDYNNFSLYDYFYASRHQTPPSTDVHLTDGGRPVSGGGGITPDVAMTEPALNHLQERLLAVESCSNFLECSPLFEFSKSYLGAHKTVPRDFEVDDQAIGEFRAYFAKQGLMLSDKDVQENRDFLNNRLRQTLIGMVYGIDQAQHLNIENDYLVQKAVDALPQAQALMDHAHEYMANRRTTRPTG